jgi:hypothetical protein
MPRLNEQKLRRRERPARIVRLDMTGPEWDWLAEQALALGIPFSTQVKNVIGIAAPAANDRARFNAMRRALFEARLATFGAFKEATRRVIAEYEANPEQFIAVSQRANPEIMASNPAWDEPDAPEGSFP